jgi:hypothetical protein
LCERDAQAGIQAADAHRRLAEPLEVSPHPFVADKHFERGVRLAMQIHKKGQQVRQHLDNILSRSMLIDPTTGGRLPADLLALLYDLRHDDAERMLGGVGLLRPMKELGRKVVGGAGRWMVPHDALRGADHVGSAA